MGVAIQKVTFDNISGNKHKQYTIRFVAPKEERAEIAKMLAWDGTQVGMFANWRGNLEELGMATFSHLTFNPKAKGFTFTLHSELKSLVLETFGELQDACTGPAEVDKKFFMLILLTAEEMAQYAEEQQEEQEDEPVQQGAEITL